MSRGDIQRDLKDGLLHLLTVNGFKEEDLRSPEKITSIEMVLDDYCCMRTLSYFPKLQSVCLIQQDIQRIEGLESCMELQRLLLNENSIQKIEGLQNCVNLQKLYLPFNCIKEVGTALDSLEQLEVLWLAGNQLRSLDALELPNLTELNLASNQLTTVLGAFERMPKLQTLNLSANQLCSYQEVLDLSRRSALTALSFADPDFGENPICALSNYSTYVLYHLPKLQVHDQMYVDPEAHQMAEAAYAKKRLFYNMRIKTLKRQSGDCLRAAQVIYEARRNMLALDHSAAARLLRRAAAFRQSRERNGRDEGDAAEMLDLNSLERHLKLCKAELADAEKLFTDLREAVKETLEAQIRCLHLELRSGGNLRFERAQDAQIQELLTSRFRASDFLNLGFRELKVCSVTRLQHRSLYLQFEQLLERNGLSLPCEYLFYIPSPRQAFEEIQAVAEAGPNCKATVNGALLTNALSLAEAGRLLHVAKTERGQAMKRCMKRAPQAAEAVAGTRGLALICKVQLGAQLADHPSCFTSNFLDVHEVWRQEPSKKDLAGTNEAQSLLRVSLEDENVKVWEVACADFILPEFLVEFEYVYDEIPSKTDAADSSIFAPLLSEYSFYSQMGVQQETGRKRKPNDLHDLSQIREEEPPSPSFTPQSPPLPNLPTIHELTRSLLAPMVSPSLKVLNLHGRNLRRIESLEQLPGLEVLLLSFNCIESLSAIPACDSLVTLDVSHNLIQKIYRLTGFPALRELDLSWNQLVEDENLEVLARDMSQLSCLDLQGNRLDTSSALRKLPRLRTLDGQVVVQPQAPKPVFELTHEVLKQHCYAPPKSFSRRLPGESGYDEEKDRISSLLLVPNSERTPFVSRANWQLKVVVVDLQGVGLTDLRFLAELPECQACCLSDNSLSLAELPALAKLEYLNIERCNLTSLKGLSRCQELQSLDAGSNHLSDALELQKLSKLNQVSLEDNFIDSLDTFAQMHSLSELYLSNNVVEELRSVLLLKQLPKLLVLDLAGNDLCKAADYRQYTMFHLRKLKVLDGWPISKAELTKADEKFSGKVTMELLEEKLGPSPSCYSFRSVDLSNLGIKEVGQLMNDDLFPSLRELVLDGNPFSDIRTLGPLSKLLVLRLNKTKLDLENGALATPGGETMGGIGTFPNLQVLEVGYSGIADMKFFAQLPLQSLRILHLPGNEITKIEALSHMEQLRELVLDKNKLKQFDEKSFEGLRALRELRVEDNGIKGLSNLGPLPRLRALYLSLNRIVELSELEKLRGLRHLLVVHMAQNPVARKPSYRLQLLHCVPSARAVDGREVTSEERERLEQIAFCDGKAAVYVFNDPPPSSVQVTFMPPPVATVQVPAEPKATAERRASQQAELDIAGLKKDRVQSARKTGQADKAR